MTKSIPLDATLRKPPVCLDKRPNGSGGELENPSPKHFQPRARPGEVNVNSVYPTSSSWSAL